MDEYYQVVQSLPSWLARPLLDMPSALAPDVQELRLRVGCAPAFTMRGAVCTPQETARELVCQKKLVSVIDERRELFSGSSRRKSPGEALDVISGIPKGQAVQMALRTLSPQILLLDELGGLDEVTALEQGLFSGVDFIATLHAASPEEAVGRPQVQALQARGALHVLTWLKGRAEPGQVREVRFL